MLHDRRDELQSKLLELKKFMRTWRVIACLSTGFVTISAHAIYIALAQQPKRIAVPQHVIMSGA